MVHSALEEQRRGLQVGELLVGHLQAARQGDSGTSGRRKCRKRDRERMEYKGIGGKNEHEYNNRIEEVGRAARGPAGWCGAGWAFGGSATAKCETSEETTCRGDKSKETRRESQNGLVSWNLEGEQKGVWQVKVYGGRDSGCGGRAGERVRTE